MIVTQKVLLVTIPAAGSDSETFDIESASAIAFVISEAFTGTELRVLVAVYPGGPFYDVGEGIVLEADAAGILSLSEEEAAALLPFRHLKLRSSAAPLSSTNLTVADDGVLAGDSDMSLGAPDGTSGSIFAGDTFTVAGDATVYTVTGGPYPISEGMISSVAFEPVLVEEIEGSGAAVTLVQLPGNGGEAAARTIQVVTKS
jgi:hypothetical protein